MPRRLAAVDIGSNTVHVLVADVHDGRLHDVAQYFELPELGPAVEKTGGIGPAKTAQALDALDSVLGQAREHAYGHLVAGATAAIRRASDSGVFLAQASARAGVPVRLIGEDREAELSFQGVASRHAAKHTWLMGDMGGGSTELVVANGPVIVQSVSLPVGSGSFAARYLSDPPRSGEREVLRIAALSEVRKAPRVEPNKLVMTGGTATNLPLVISRRSPPSVLNTGALVAAVDRLDAGPAVVVSGRLGLPEARVRALRGGTELLLLLLDFYSLDEFHVSHEGLRHGMLLAWLQRGEDWWR